MLNRYSLWKNLLILAAILVGFIYAMPNLYPDDYAVQISGARSSTAVDRALLERATKAMDAAELPYRGAVLQEKNLLLRFDGAEDQLKAKANLQRAMGDDYLVALNLAPTTPGWLKSLNAGPMKLGLDLRGGVHFLLEVDMEKAIAQRLDLLASEIKRQLREEKIRYRGGSVRAGRQLDMDFRTAADRDAAETFVQRQYHQFEITSSEQEGLFRLTLALTPAALIAIEDYAIEQNLTTLRNRVNELGVAEPLVQRQGRNRIVVELPGVQDTAQAKRVLGATANLEFRLEARADAEPGTTESFGFRDSEHRSATIEKEIIATGNNVSDAQQNFDESGRPQVSITLDSIGGEMMFQATRNAIQRAMAVVFIEQKTEAVTRLVDGKPVTDQVRKESKKIISLATIQSALGSSFRITGLDSIPEASELALLLRAGSLAAPMFFVEERTVGPSLGQQNIEAGLLSGLIGFAVVIIYMAFYYRVFGLIANGLLAINIVILMAGMSLIGATLTLPGIAGIVLTMGMAVDANVLIFERIKEELRNGLPPQSAINAGFERAFVTIFDANITTLLAAILLFWAGTGPVKGFAITLSIGIATSMFTAIWVGRAAINLIYGGRKVQRLLI